MSDNEVKEKDNKLNPNTQMYLDYVQKRDEEEAQNNPYYQPKYAEDYMPETLRPLVPGTYEYIQRNPINLNPPPPQQDPMDVIRQSNVFKKLFQTKAEALQEANDISIETGIPVEVITSSTEARDKARSIYNYRRKLMSMMPEGENEFDEQKVFEAYPELDKLSKMSTTDAAIALHNMKNTKQIHNIVEAFKTNWRLDSLTASKGRIGFNAMNRGYFTDKEKKILAEIDKEMESYKETPGLLDEPGIALVGGIASQAGLQLRGLLRGQYMGYVGAGFGALVGALAGGTVTLGTGMIPAAMAGAAYGYSVGNKIGWAEDMYRETVGLNFIDLTGYKNADGSPALSKNEARVVAAVMAAVETKLEFQNWDRILNVLQGVKSNSKQKLKQIISKAKDNETFQAALKGFLKDTVGGAAEITISEAWEEVEQEFANRAITAFVAGRHPGSDIPNYSFIEMLQGGAEAGIAAIPATLGMGLMAGAAGTTGPVRRIASAMQIRNTYYEGQSLNARFRNMIRELWEDQKTSKLYQEHKPTYEKVVQANLEGSQFENTYIDTEMLAKEENGTEIIRTLGKEAGMKESEIEAAIANNEDLKIPTVTYAQTSLDNSLKEIAQKYITHDPDAACLMRATEYAKKCKEEMFSQMTKDMEAQARAMETFIKDNFGNETEETQEAARRLLLMNPENPRRAGREELKRIWEKLKNWNYVEPIYKYIKQNSKQGYILTPNPKAEPWEYAPGMIRESLNDPWYRKLVKEKKGGSAFTDDSAWDMAINIVAGNDYYNTGYGPLFFGSPEEANMVAAEEGPGIETLQDEMYYIMDAMSVFKDLDTKDLTLRGSMTNEGYKAYQRVVAVLKQGPTEESRAAATVQAIVAAKIFDTLAAYYRESGMKDVTALDIMDRLYINLGDGPIRLREDGTAVTPDGQEVKYANNQNYNQAIGEKGAERLGTFYNSPVYNKLGIAKKMLEAGKSIEEIHKKTGWYQLADGKWRYEIPDDFNNINVDKLYELLDNSERVMGELVASEGKSIWTTLRKVYKNPKLYQAYPFLKGLKITINNKMFGAYGDYNPDTMTITLNSLFLDVARDGDNIEQYKKDFPDADDAAVLETEYTGKNVKETFIHEIQHAIQDYEGHAQGGNDTLARNLSSALLIEARDKIEKETGIPIDTIDSLLLGEDYSYLLENPTSLLTIIYNGKNLNRHSDLYHLIARLWDNFSPYDKADNAALSSSYADSFKKSIEERKKRIDKDIKTLEEDIKIYQGMSNALSAYLEMPEDSINIVTRESIKQDLMKWAESQPSEIREKVHKISDHFFKWHYNDMAYIRRTIESDYLDIKKHREELKSLESLDPSKIEMGPDISNALNKLKKSKYGNKLDKNNIDLINQYAELIKLATLSSNFSLYERLLGEREARNATEKAKAYSDKSQPLKIRKELRDKIIQKAIELEKTNPGLVVTPTENKDRVEVSWGGITARYITRESENESYNQTAYHGTWRDRLEGDRFSLDYAYTGEGADAHGYGLYFALKRKTAKNYQRILTNNKNVGYRAETDIKYDGKDLDKDSKLQKLITNILFDNYMNTHNVLSTDTKADFKDAINQFKKRRDERIEYAKEGQKVLKEFSGLIKEGMSEAEIWDALRFFIMEKSPEEREKKYNFWSNQVMNYGPRHIKERIETWLEKLPKDIKEWNAEIKDAESIDPAKVEIAQYKGKVFKVEVPDDDVLMDENKDFKDQPKIVQQAIDKIIETLPDERLADLGDTGRGRAYAIKEAKEMFHESDGRRIYNNFIALGWTAQETSELFNDYGVKGIKYDGRQDGPCVVIFDDNAVEIINKTKKSDVQRYNQTAWHGSPYEFDKFDLGAIGTGEGAQVHGWGLYFSKNEYLAKNYQASLSNRRYGGTRSNSIFTASYKGKEINLEPSSHYRVNTAEYWIHRLLEGGIDPYSPETEYKKLFKETVDHKLNNIGERVERAQEGSNKWNKVADKIIGLCTKEGLEKITPETRERLEKELYKETDGMSPFRELDYINAALRIIIDMKAAGETPESISENINRLLSNMTNIWKQEIAGWNNQYKAIKRIDFEKLEIGRAEGYGRHYKVNIPEDYEMLTEWEDLKDQALHVRKAMKALIESLSDSQIEDYGDISYEGRDAVNKKMYDIYMNTPGRKIYRDLSRMMGGPKEASLLLNEYGIKGIRYDGMQDGLCYVVFDDESVDIIEKYNQRAFHGTPHTFDNFDFGAIGTGEGNAAHGYGLYFAKNQEVSEGYRAGLSNIMPWEVIYDGNTGNNTIPGSIIDRIMHGLSWDTDAETLKSKVIEEIKESIKDFRAALKRDEKIIKGYKYALKFITEENISKLNDETFRNKIVSQLPLNQQINLGDRLKSIAEEAPTKWETYAIEQATYYANNMGLRWYQTQSKHLIQMIKNYESIDPKKIELKETGINPGMLLEVEIPENDVLLNEDLPYEQQPPKVQKALKKLINSLSDETLYNYYDISHIGRAAALNDLWRMISVAEDGKTIYGTLWDIIGDSNGRDISLLMNQYGIKGIRYEGRLDGEGFVIFDDKAIDIINRLNQAAWHGTWRNEIENNRFSTDFIGTGEGATAHGWGLYFASQEEIAEGYQKKLTYRINDKERWIYDGELINTENEKNKLYESLRSIEDYGLEVYYKENLNAAAPDFTPEFYEKGKARVLELYKRYAKVNEADIAFYQKIQNYVEQHQRIGIFPQSYEEYAKKTVDEITNGDKDIERRISISANNFGEYVSRYYEDKVPAKDAMEALMDIITDKLQELREEQAEEKEIADTVKSIDVSKIEQDKEEYTGSRYQVEIPNDETMLIEYESFENQPEIVKKAIWEIFDTFTPEQKKNLVWGKIGIKNPKNITINELAFKVFTGEINIYNTMPGGKNIYENLVEMLSNGNGRHEAKRQASLMLNAHGVEGIKYDGRQDGICYVVFNDDAITIIDRYEQDRRDKQEAMSPQQPQNKGTIEINSRTGQKIISLFQIADQSTFIHEMAHFALDEIFRISALDDAPEQLKKDIETLKEWMQWGKKKNKGQTVLTREQHEMFAQGFEAYIYKGEAPTPVLKNVFRKLAKMMSSIYQSVSQIMTAKLGKEDARNFKPGSELPEPSPAVIAVMSRLIASQEEIDAAIRAKEIKSFEKAGGLKFLDNTTKGTFEKMKEEMQADAEEKLLNIAMEDLREENRQARAQWFKETEDYTREIYSKQPEFIIAEVLKKMPHVTKAEEDQTIIAMGMTPEEYHEKMDAAGGSLDAAVEKYMKEMEEDPENALPDDESLRESAKRIINESRYREQKEAFELEALMEIAKRQQEIAKKVPKEFKTGTLSEEDINALEEQTAENTAETMEETPKEVETDEPEMPAEENLETAPAEEAEQQTEMEETPAEEKWFTAEEPETVQSVKARAKKDIAAEKRKTVKARLERDLQKQGVKVTRDATKGRAKIIRAAALEKMADLSIREACDEAKWRNLADRSINNCFNAMGKFDFTNAVLYKQQAAFYSVMSRLAAENSRSINKLESKLQQKAKTATKSNNLPADERYAFMHLMYVFKMLKSDVKLPEEYPGFDSLIRDKDGYLENSYLDEEGNLDMPDFIINAATDNKQRPDGYKDLKVSEFKTLADLLFMLYKTGADTKKAKVIKDEYGNLINLDEGVSIIRAEANENLESRENWNASSMERQGTIERLAELSNNFLLDLTKMETICRQLGKAAMRFIYDPIQEAAMHKLRLWREYDNKIREFLSVYAGQEHELFNKKKYRIGDNLITKEQVICLGLNWGTELNKKRIVDGFKVSETEVETLLATLDSKDWDFITKIWGLLDSYWAETKRIEESMTGVVLEKEKAVPFTIIGNDGNVYRVPGGYYPIKYDHTKNIDVGERAADDALKITMSGQSRLGMRRGHTKQRVKGRVEYEVRLDFNVITEALDDVTNNIAFRETVRDVNRIIRNKEFTQLIKEKYGNETEKQLRRWVLDCWAHEPQVRGTTDTILCFFRKNATASVLGFRVVTAVLNIGNIGPAMCYLADMEKERTGKHRSNLYGAAALIQSMLRFYNHPLQLRQFVMNKSIFMAERESTMDRDVRNVLEGNKYNSFTEAAFWIISETDLMVALPMWLREYEQTMKHLIDKKVPLSQAEHEAIKAGDASVRRVIQSGMTHDLSRIQRGSEAEKALTMYMSYMNTVYNALVMKNFERKRLRKQGAGILRSMVPLADGIIMWILVPSALIAASRLGMSDDDWTWENFIKGWIGEAADTTCGSIPLIREFAPGLVRHAIGERTFGTRGIPAQEFLNQIEKILDTVFSQKKNKIDVLHEIVRLMAMGGGISNTAFDAIATTIEWIDEDFDSALAEYLRAVVLDKRLHRRKRR